MTLEELLAQLEKLAAEMRASQEKMQEGAAATEEEVAEAKAALAAHETKQAELITQLKNMDQKLIAVELAQKSFRPANGRVDTKSLGRHFVESGIFAEIKSIGRGNDKPLSIERKSITSLAASAGALVEAYRDPEVYTNPQRPIRVRDLVPTVTTDTGSIEVVRQLAVTNNAGPQGTVAGIGGGELVAKNQSNMRWEEVTYPVRTMAHWVPASRQVLADAPMLQSLIDTELVYGLDLLSDAQLLYGTGAGQNVTGIMVDPAVPSVGELPAGTATADIPSAMIDHIRAAVTAMQTNEYYNPNGIVLNPADWGLLETAKASDGHYLMIQFPANGGDQRIWRMPVIVTNAMNQGEFVLGDWRLGAKLYAREDISVRISESHAGFFVQNAVAILAEERYAFAVNRPLAFVKGEFSVAAV